MRKSLNQLLCLIAASFIALTTSAYATNLQMGVSDDEIPVGSDFAGANLVVFGSIEGVSIDALNRGEYNVVVKVTGGEEDVVIRQKERTFGIWINNESQKFENVPSFYSVISGKPLADIGETEALQKAGLGVENLGAAIASEQGSEFVLDASKFSSALRRIKVDKGLFIENEEGLTQLSPSLFRARVELPPNVPIGMHTVTAYLFRNGQQLVSKSVNYRIGKVGFERWIYNLAHEQSFLYGVLAVFMAIFTGWAANAIFRKN